MDDLVRDATMLGVRAIVPAHTDHSSVSRREGAAPVARWRRIAITSSKQCGRAVVPIVSSPMPLEAALDVPAAVKLLLAEPAVAAGACRRLEDLAERARAGGAVIAAGPEGGWSAAEVQAAGVAGYRLWSLGTQILRAETVPLAALSVLRYAWSL
jgi:16S rRNA (uracil1498-N3)-methyltransferase